MPETNTTYQNRAAWKAAIDAEVNRILSRDDYDRAQLEREKQVAEQKNKDARRALRDILSVITPLYINGVEPENRERYHQFVRAISQIKSIALMSQQIGGVE